MGFMDGYRNQKLRNQRRHLGNAYDHIATVSEERNDLEYNREQWITHHAALKAQNEYLMGLLDEAYGQDKNPARELAYEDPDELRIPSGDRKGDAVTMADHIYLTEFAALFKKYIAPDWNVKSWKEFLYERISY